MYTLEHDINEAEVIVTYAHCETLHETVFSEIKTKDELKEFVTNLFEKYYEFAKMEYENAQIMTETARALKFPYDNYRQNQRGFMAWVYKTVKENKKMFCQAPTGTGKTISTIFPGVKALGEGRIKKVFYLTAKTSTRIVAEEAFAKMENAGFKAHAITLTGKEKICPMPAPDCNPHSCEYAKGHFDRVNDAIFDIIKNETVINRKTVIKYAQTHRVCPHEFSFDISLFCDIIICDYNYVYDPKAYLRRFFDNDNKNPYLVLNDEAHNLADRARDMFSAEIERESFKAAKKTLANKKSPFYKSAAKADSFLGELYNTHLSEEKFVKLNRVPEELGDILTNFLTNADKWLASNQTSPGFDGMLETYFAVLDFLRAADNFSSGYICLLSSRFGKNSKLKLKCADPSYLLSQTQKKVTASVYFSATMTPIDYFKNVLGGSADDFCVCAPSPFNEENLCVLADGTISTKYKDRPACYEKIAEDIYAFTSAKKGNYFVFFSSYEFLYSVAEIFNVKYPQVNTAAQNKDMTEDERDGFLQRFGVLNEETLIGFLVLGGVFSEGVDLAGDKLIGAVVVGVGLPLITKETDMIADFFGKANGRGFEYAYMYPGMNKVLQAAGRVIRHETDIGALLLIDTRFLSGEYRKLFPPHWRHLKVTQGSAAVARAASQFWAEKGK
jgi:Rad3-related DNA helicase